MLLKPSSCSTCALGSRSSGFSYPEGTGQNRVFVVAEALGEKEAEVGLPLRPWAQAGGVFDRALQRVGLERNAFTIYNTIQCRPPNDWLVGAPWETEAIEHCRPNIFSAIRAARPRVILALGGVAAKEQTAFYGHKKGVSFIRGYLLDSPHFLDDESALPIPVLSTYHPSFLARGKTNLTGVFGDDIRTAFRFAQLGRRGWSRPSFANFIIQPPPDFCERWARDQVLPYPERDITYDIETRESLSANDESEVRALDGGRVLVTPVDLENNPVNPGSGTSEDEIMEEAVQVGMEGGATISRTVITQIQFSIAPDHAIVVPWSAEYFPFIRMMLGSVNQKFGFNCWQFDDPLLRDSGIGIRFGSIPHDLMWMWHHWQPDLPRGLQFCSSFFAPECEPWKHLADANAGLYGSFDVAHPQRIKSALMAKLKSEGLWWGYERHVYALHLTLDSASVRGWPCNEKKQTEFDRELTIEQHVIFKELQEEFPAHLKRIEPKGGKGYGSDKVAEKGYRAAYSAILAGDPEWEWRRYEQWERRRFECEQRKKKLGKNDLGVQELPGKLPGYVKLAKPKKVGKREQANLDRVSVLNAFSGGTQAPGTPAFNSQAAMAIADSRIHAAEAVAIAVHAHPGVATAAMAEGALRPTLPDDGRWWEGDDSYFYRRAQVERWCRIQPFLPNSSQQILDYIRLKKYKVPLDQKTKKPTTAKKEILALGRKHQDKFFGKIIGFREMHKIRSTYLWDLDSKTTFAPLDPAIDAVVLDKWYEESKLGATEPDHRIVNYRAGVPEHGEGWKFSDRDEAYREAWNRIKFVHTQFGFSPATGQLGSRQPAIQNQPKKGRLAERFRSMIEAKPGYKIVELDYTAYHALTLGFESLCPEYMWIAARDIHSFVAGHLLRVPGHERWREMAKNQDEELTQILAWWKERGVKEFDSPQGLVKFKWYRDFKAKPAILGIGFGLGAHKMWMMNEDSFSSMAEAKLSIDMVKGLFPPVFQFQDMIREKAFAEKRLISAHCYHRWFWDVYHWQRVHNKSEIRQQDGVRRLPNGDLYKKAWGEDSEAAIAFLPANDAFGHIKEVMIDLECARGGSLMERYGLINQIHDALVFHCRYDRVESLLADVVPAMQRRSLILKNQVAPDGLSCGVEASVGQNWNEMKKVAVH